MSQEHSGFFIDTRQGVIDDPTEFYEWQLLRSFIGLDIYWHAQQRTCAVGQVLLN